jgi:outer membrane protein OmpA-like peptidoglycan-associated protein
MILRKLELCSIGVLALSLLASEAAAQVRLDRYIAPASPNDGLRLTRPEALGDRQLGALLVFDYADDPLVLELERGLSDTETASLVARQLEGHARFTYGLYDRLVLSGGVDFAVMMAGDHFNDRASGTTLAPADGAGLGDVRLGARYVALGSAGELGAVAIDVQTSLPLARGVNSGQNLSGERGATLSPALIGELRPGPVRLTANAGVLIRKNSALLGARVRDELTFGIGAALRLPAQLRDLEAISELYGSTDILEPFDAEQTPIEALFGARYHVGEQWQVSLAGGPGMRRGLGSPDLRAIASLGFVGVGQADLDGDSVSDDIDRCPNEAEDRDGHDDEDGCPDLDNDRDGVPDSADRCPGEPEDPDGFNDGDGCADLDNDQDGVPDATDQCPAQAEDRDGDRDQDGCPDVDLDLDSDGDGIADSADRCKSEREDADGFQDEDGCPDPDNDSDGVLDAEDECPLVAGTIEKRGCAAVHVEGSQIRIDERIEFAPGGAEIVAESQALMEQIRVLLEKNPQIRKVAVQGFTDATGAAPYNQKLSERRAKSVVQWLAQHGIEASRLSAWGCGSSRPLADDSSPQGRQQNRRVELHILEPAPEHEAASDCRQVPSAQP